jgi:hypothetical protein
MTRFKQCGKIKCHSDNPYATTGGNINLSTQYVWRGVNWFQKKQSPWSLSGEKGQNNKAKLDDF